jgi:hypothetical protein
MPKGHKLYPLEIMLNFIMNQTRTLLQIETKVKVLRFTIPEGLIIKKGSKNSLLLKNSTDVLLLQ